MTISVSIGYLFLKNVSQGGAFAFVIYIGLSLLMSLTCSVCVCEYLSMCMYLYSCLDDFYSILEMCYECCFAKGMFGVMLFFFWQCMGRI